jgi:Fe-S cluster biogenesis protein NfuA
MTAEEKFQAINEFLNTEIRDLLKATAGKNPDLSQVVVWLLEINPQNNVVILGLALGTATGCSPFCGCAANQITEVIERIIKREFDWVRKVVGQASVPTQEIINKWNR